MKADRATILEELGTARRYADPEAPLKARLMAAGGVLPLPPDQLASVLFALTTDPDPQVKDRAVQSLERLPDQIIDTVLQARVHPALLAFMAEHSKDNEQRLEKLALNPAAADETLCELARLPFPRLVDILAQNQTRLLRCPELFEALGENPVIGQATIDRILEFLGLEQAAPEAAFVAPDAAVAAEVTAPPAPLDAAETDTLPREFLEDTPEAQAEGSPERCQALQGLVQHMNVMEKVKLARFGNQEARALLIRDRNKLVASAAIRSPKITENEVLQFSKSRNLDEEILRIIANRREWTKNYPVKLALCTNPKTPAPAAIKFLNTLTDRDLRTVMRSRDIPIHVSQNARRILARKGKV